jgi:hypothetical protein
LNPKQRGHQHTTNRLPKLRQAATTFGLTLALAVLASMLLTSTCYQQYTLTGAYVREYEGKILDKSQTITESQTGSGVRRRLLIEGRDGKKFQVAISEATYEQARKGMWIKKTEAAGVELVWPAEATLPESPAPGNRR